MRLLLDTCVWGGAKSELERLGHDAVWSGDWPADPGDMEILELARREERVLVTLDKDFGELAILRDFPHCGIVRLVGLRARDHSLVGFRAGIAWAGIVARSDCHCGTWAFAFEAGLV